jgi:hypothetical protein
LLLSFLQQFLHGDQNAKIVEEKKAAKCKVAEAKEKVKYHKVLSFLFQKYMVQLQIALLFLLLGTCYLHERSLKQHIQEEMEKIVMSNGTSLSILEYDAPLF